MKNSTLRLAVFVSVVLESNGFGAGEIHVSHAGSDSASGSAGQPYLTINKAASVAQPGDTVIVHGGTYREWVKPIRGGTNESNRIVYRAAPGEEVLVKGSERVTTWIPEGEGVWKVEVPNSFFSDYNPYELTLSGGWLNYGQWHHRGDVYLNGEAFYEKQTAQEVTETERTWFCQANANVTTIRANFGKANPNTELTEINVRESIFMPEVTGLKYITVDGFHFMHAAANWAPPVLPLQTGAVGTRMGRNWIIENCTVVNARCVGIILGHAPGVDYADINAFGDHIIRNNVIRRCGQAGIAGQKGATRSLISGNLIEDTNHRREFGGWETAAIKLLVNEGTLVRRNLISECTAAPAVWLDWDNKNSRITQNLIFDIQICCNGALFVEASQTPNMIDHNVLWNIRGVGIYTGDTDNLIIAHNLIGPCTGPGVYTHVATDRHVNGRAVTSKGNRVVQNIFYTAEPIHFGAWALSCLARSIFTAPS